jgi:hypothetical protein
MPGRGRQEEDPEDGGRQRDGEKKRRHTHAAEALQRDAQGDGTDEEDGESAAGQPARHGRLTGQESEEVSQCHGDQAPSKIRLVHRLATLEPSTAAACRTRTPVSDR